MDVVSWDAHNINDTTNYVSFLHHQAYGLPKVSAQSIDRMGRWPTVAGINRPGRVMYLEIIIRNLSQLAAKQVELQQWFDPEDETPKKLIVEDLGGGTGGGNDRYVYAICEELQAAPNDENNYTFIATLRVHGDVRWRENTASTQSWAITGTGDTEAVTNNGKDDAYPVLTITPTSAKTVGYAYRRYSNIKWRATAGAIRYPIEVVDILDTDALVTAGKMQADGDDLRVYVDGVQVTRWLDGINTTTTQCWANIDFQPTQQFELATAIASGSTPPDTIDIVDDITGLPDEGYVFVSDEVFHYTSKNNANRQLLGITRGELGTSTAAHATTHLVLWLQHVVEVFYGNSTTAGPVANDTYKPIFDLATSTNTSWVYASFGDGVLPTPSVRAGAWAQTTRSFSGSQVYQPYTADGGADADPWSEIGLYSYAAGASAGPARWYLYNPCGISNANFTNGEKYQTDDNSVWSARVISATNPSTWRTEYTIVKPDPVATWVAWSTNEAIAITSYYVGIELLTTGAGDYLEVADCTITVNVYPVVQLSAELGNYGLSATITNNTTGEAIVINFNMAIDASLEVDTYDKTIIYLLNNSNQLQALTLSGGARKDWLRLQPGANTLQFDDASTNGVTIGLSWEERHYQ